MMNWKDYEKEVHSYFSQMYPNSKITYNAKIVGRYSKVERQIDVLIEDDLAGFPLKVVVDAKYFSENIDVRCVESFISMLEDVNANQGLCAIPYAGKNSLLLSAPIGWVIDIRKQDGFIACLYQRGTDLPKAQKKMNGCTLTFGIKIKMHLLSKSCLRCKMSGWHLSITISALTKVAPPREKMIEIPISA